MSLRDRRNITWTAALDLLNREINRLQSMPVSENQVRYSEAVLLHEAAYLSAVIVKTIRKILIYLKHVEHMSLSRQEHLQRGVMTCYLVECVQLWTVYGLPCVANYSEFLYLSECLPELLQRYDPSTPFHRPDKCTLLLGLLSRIKLATLGRDIRPQTDLMLPYRGDAGRNRTAAYMYRALRNLTCVDTVNRCYPYAFLYGTYRELTAGTRVGLNRRRLETYLHADVRRLFLQHKRAIVMEDSLDFPDFGECAPDMNWHALQVACRFYNLRQQRQQDRQTEETIEERHEIHFSASEVFAWRTTSQWSQPTPTCSDECIGASQDGAYVSMAVERAQTPDQRYTFSPAPVKVTDQEVTATTTTAASISPSMRTTAPVRMTDQGVAAATTTTLKTSPLTRTTTL